MEKEEKNNFGVPKVDNSPMGIVQMEGDLYRKAAENKNRPIWLRVSIIVFSIIVIILPGVFFIFSSFDKGVDNDSVSIFTNVIFGFFYILIGAAIIKPNLKNSKNSR